MLHGWTYCHAYQLIYESLTAWISAQHARQAATTHETSPISACDSTTAQSDSHSKCSDQAASCCSTFTITSKPAAAELKRVLHPSKGHPSKGKKRRPAAKDLPCMHQGVCCAACAKPAQHSAGTPQHCSIQGPSSTQPPPLHPHICILTGALPGCWCQLCRCLAGHSAHNFCNLGIASRQGAELCSIIACSRKPPSRPQHRLLQCCGPAAL